MALSHSTRRMLGALITCIVIVTIAWYAYMLITEKKEPATQNTNVNATAVNNANSNTNTSDGVVVATTNKTYSNDEYGVSFAYPSNWNLSQTDDNTTLVVTVSGGEGTDSPTTCPTDVASVQFQVGHTRPASVSFDDYVNNELHSDTESLGAVSGTLEKMDIDGKAAYKAQSVGFEGPCQQGGYIIEQGEDRYILIGISTDATIEENAEIVKKVAESLHVE